MQAGKLNKRLEIQSVHEVLATIGTTKTWITDNIVWGSIEPIRGMELMQAQQVSGLRLVRIKIRYLAGLTTSMRLKCGARIFSITAILDTKERHAELEIMATEAGV